MADVSEVTVSGKNPSSWGSRLADSGLNMLTGGISSLASNFIGSMFGKDNYDYQMQRNKEYQEWLLTNGKKLEVQGLKNAGLSPSFAKDAGSVGSVPGAQMSAPDGGMSQAITSLSSALLADKQANLVEQTRKRMVALLGGERGLLDKQNNILEIQARVAEATEDAQIKKVLSDANLVEQNYLALKEQRPEQLQNLKRSITELEQRARKEGFEGDISKQAASLAKEYGIFQGDDALKALIHLILKGKASAVINQLFSAIKDAGSSLVNNVLGSLGLE